MNAWKKARVNHSDGIVSSVSFFSATYEASCPLILRKCFSLSLARSKDINSFHVTQKRLVERSDRKTFSLPALATRITSYIQSPYTIVLLCCCYHRIVFGGIHSPIYSLLFRFIVIVGLWKWDTDRLSYICDLDDWFHLIPESPKH